jgi:hypothetical protein
MKLHPDPSPEFSHLVKSRWERFVLFWLEISARQNPLSITGFLCFGAFVIAGQRWLHRRDDPYPEFWMILLFVVVLATELFQIYASRAILEIMRRNQTRSNAK